MRLPRHLLTTLAAIAGLILPANSASAAEPEAVKLYGVSDGGPRLVVRSTTDIVLMEPVLQAFVSGQPNTLLRYEQWGSNDLFARAAETCAAAAEGRAGDATGDAAGDTTGGADLLISSAVDLQIKLVNDGCSHPHAPSEGVQLSDVTHWRSEVFGITLEPAVIVYNKEFVSPEEAPHSRFDILDLLRPEGSRFAGRVATYDIQESGLGYLFAFMDSQQANTFGSMIEAFARSGAIATCCSAEIIDGVVDGRYLIAYNVLGSYALARAETAPGLVVVAPSDYTLLLRRAALIPKDAPNKALGGQFLDFLLSRTGQGLLSEVHLITDPARAGPGGLHAPVDTQAALRQIPLSPVLLVGLDQQKRAAFMDLWKSTFQSENNH